jgi:hypothetical protein
MDIEESPMSKDKDERAYFDLATREWFKNNIGAQTTVMKCERCGLYYKPILGHKTSHCRKIIARGDIEYALADLVRDV